MTSKNSPKITQVLLLGIGSWSIEIADLINDIPNYKAVGFVVDRPPYEPGQNIFGIPVYWIDEIISLVDHHYVLSAIGTTKRKNFIQKIEGMGFRFATILHPSARISKLSIVNKGSIISYGVQIGAQTQIGCHVNINRGALLGHNISVEDYVTISPGANLASNVVIKEQARIGMGANIIQNCTIGSRAIVGAGSLVKMDVPERTFVEGVPAKIVAENINGI
jgi:sugar O-acyltransferase (sialic acid O-acetyltransferase NeuD family)